MHYSSSWGKSPPAANAKTHPPATPVDVFLSAFSRLDDSPTSVTARSPTLRPFPIWLGQMGSPSSFHLHGRNEFPLASRFCSAKRLYGPSARPASRGPGRPSNAKRAAACAAALLSAFSRLDYSPTSVTAPEPTVRPPSRIAKRRPFSMAMGVISSTLISTLSPGMHISTPSGRVMTPVTSVVRK